jgi:hypothetical protein
MAWSQEDSDDIPVPDPEEEEPDFPWDPRSAADQAPGRADRRPAIGFQVRRDSD